MIRSDTQPTSATAAADPRPVIGHVLHRMQYAGAEVLARDLAADLSPQFRFVFLCLDGVGDLGHELEDHGAVLVDLGRRPGVDLAVARRLRQAVSRHGIGLLHAHQYTPFFYAAMARRRPLPIGPLTIGPPILFTEHGRHYPDVRSWKRVKANRYLLRRTDRVTAVGHFVKQALVNNEGIPYQRIEVIHNGIEPDFLPPDQRETARRTRRDELGLADDEPVVLQVARFHPVKDHATGVRAFARALDEAPRARLVLVGDGDEREATEQLVHELGIADRVHFLGVRTDVPHLMAATDVFMLSSLSEGISVTLLEAMACSLPIATTNVGGNPEVVAHEETGLLSPRQAPDALAVNLATLLTDPDRRQRYGRAGRERLIERFTQQQMHAGYARVYREMLGVPQPAAPAASPALQP